MTLLLTLLLIVTSITLAGFLFAEGWLCKRPGSQDFVWRLTLAATLLIPPAFVLSSYCLPDGLVQLPWLNHSAPLTASIMAEDSQDLPAPQSVLSGVAAPISAAGDSRSQRPESAAQSTSTPVSEAQPDNSRESDSLRTLASGTLNEPTAGSANSDDLITATTGPESESASGWLIGLVEIAGQIWLFGSVGLLLQLVVGWLGLLHLRRDASSNEPRGWASAIDVATSDAGLRKRLTVRGSKKVATPMVAGCFKPVVLVPVQVAKIRPVNPSVRALLTHEAMHIARADAAWNVALRLAVALWWPVPTVHLMARQIGWLRELMCDAGVASRMNVVDYAETLLQLATMPRQRVSLLGLPMQANGRSLESRIDWLFEHSPTESRTPNRAIQLTTYSSLVVVMLVFATVRLVPVVQPPVNHSAAVAIQDQESSPEESDQEFPVEDRTVISGTIRDDAGNPVTGGTVFLWNYPSGSYTLPVHPLVANADDDGVYKFTNVQPGNYAVWAETESLTSLENYLQGKRIAVNGESKGTSDLDLELHRGCEYEVVVVSEDGTPIPNARIEFGWTDIEREYRTGDDGAARIGALAQNEWYFVVRADGFATQFKKTAKQKLGTVEKVEFKLVRGSGVRVRLTDQNNEPVSGAKFYVGPSDISMSPDYGRPVTDDQGRFELTGLPVGEQINLNTTIEGYETEWYHATPDTVGELTEVELKCEKLPYGGDILFSVVDEEGNPVANASLSNMGSSSSQVREVTTDQNGNALMENLYRSHDNCDVVVRAPGMIPRKIPVDPGTRDAPAEIKIELDHGGTVRGTVVTHEGEPVPNVTVYYNDGNRGDGELGGSTKADDKGRFQISGLPEQSTLTVYTPAGFAPLEGMPVEIKLGDVTDVEVNLSPEAVIRARAVDAETGEPIPQFNIKIGFCEDRREGDASSGGISSTWMDQGVNVHGTTKEFLLDHLNPGSPFKLIVSAEGYETREIPRVVSALVKDAVLMVVELTKKE